MVTSSQVTREVRLSLTHRRNAENYYFKIF